MLRFRPVSTGSMQLAGPQSETQSVRFSPATVHPPIGFAARFLPVLVGALLSWLPWSVEPTQAAMESQGAFRAANSYRLTTNVWPDEGGLVNITPPGPIYGEGTYVTVTAEPSPGYHFVSWSGDLTGTTNPASIVMDSDKTITANFALDTHTLTTQVTPAAGGSISSDLPGPVYEHGTLVELTAVPAAGYDFVSWGGDLTGSDNPSSLVMDGDKSVTATFAAHQWTLTASAGSGGTITPSGAVGVSNGGARTFTITPNAEYLIADVLVDGASVGAVTNYAFTDVTANHTIAATSPRYLHAHRQHRWHRLGRSIRAESRPVRRSVVCSRCSPSTPDAGDEIADLLAGRGLQRVRSRATSSTTASRTNKTDPASFALTTLHRITASAGTGGSISPSGPVLVDVRRQSVVHDHPGCQPPDRRRAGGRRLGGGGRQLRVHQRPGESHHRGELPDVLHHHGATAERERRSSGAPTRRRTCPGPRCTSPRCLLRARTSTGWCGDASGSTSPVDVVMNGHKTDHRHVHARAVHHHGERGDRAARSARAVAVIVSYGANQSFTITPDAGTRSPTCWWTESRWGR